MLAASLALPFAYFSRDLQRLIVLLIDLRFDFVFVDANDLVHKHCQVFEFLDLCGGFEALLNRKALKDLIERIYMAWQECFVAGHLREFQRFKVLHREGLVGQHVAHLLLMVIPAYLFPVGISVLVAFEVHVAVVVLPHAQYLEPLLTPRSLAELGYHFDLLLLLVPQRILILKDVLHVRLLQFRKAVLLL